MVDMTPGVGPGPKPQVTPLQTLTYSGLPLGMITAVPKYDIPDGGAAYIQDALLDLPNIVRMRGPLQPVSGIASFSGPVFGAVSVYDPGNTFQVGVVDGTASGSFWRLASNFTTKTQITTGGLNFLQTSPWTLFHTSQCVNGGALIGLSRYYETGQTSQVQALFHWRGAQKSWSTGTITTTLSSTLVTGVGTSWLGNTEPGMFLMDSTLNLIGVVKSVNNGTSITLEEPALLAVSGAAYQLIPVRGVSPTVTVGEITCSTTAATVTGSNTKFKKQGLDSGTWDIFRLRDKVYIGTVSSVANDTALTLSANAAINCNVDNYVAIQRAQNLHVGYPKGIGWITASYAKRQFYANQDVVKQGAGGIAGVGKGNYLWFSEQNNFESVDLSAEDGDFIPISSGSGNSDKSPIKALAPNSRSLVILKDTETFVLTGFDKEQFQVDKVWDDGTLSGMSVQMWNDDVLWAGRNGIYAWDGAKITDLTKDTLGVEYRYALSQFNPSTSRMWSAITRDHYLLTIESVNPRLSVTKGGSTTTPSQWTIALNLKTGAISLWTQFNLRGSLQLPSTVIPSTWLLAYDGSIGVICDGNAIFDVAGYDNYGSIASAQDFYVDSKRYPLGDPIRRKLMKQIAMYYKIIGGTLSVDTIVGPGDTTKKTNSITFTDTSTAVDQWGKKRYKFLLHDNYIGFRFYPAATSPTIVLGPFQIAFKTQNPGRI